MQIKTLIYARISKDGEGRGLGVERQRDDCVDLADRLGWTVVDTLTDNDISAFSGKRRPGYEKLCKMLEAGEADAVIVWHTDRLHRRLAELEPFIDLCGRRSVRFETVRAGSIDLATPSGRAVTRINAAIDQGEVEKTVDRIKRAKKQAAMNGAYRGGRRAFGYEPDGKKTRPVEANAIRTAVDSLLSGVSLRQICRDWNAAGLRTSLGGKEFNSREVRKILLRPRNAGLSMHEGKPVAEGAWEKIIDPDTFHAVEAILRDPGRSQHISTERKHQGSGVYVCGICGAPMVGSMHNRTAGEWRRTYVCSASKHLGRDVDHLDAFVDEIVIGVLSRPDAPLRLGAPAVDVAALHGKREGLRARLDDLSAMFADGSIDGPQLKRGSAELRAQLDGIDAQLAAARSASALANLVLAGDDLRAVWHNTAPDVRGKVIDVLMTVTVLPAKRGRRPGGEYFDPNSVDVKPKTP